LTQKHKNYLISSSISTNFLFLSHFTDIIKEIDRNTFYGKKIAVDISILIYQVVIASKNHESKLANKTGETVSHILGLFNKTIFFLDKGIISNEKIEALKKNILKNENQIVE
jgi:hypothetical protein